MIEPPIVYAGSKFKLLPQLLPLFPSADRFVDAFAGGGAVWSNVLDRYPAVVANDIIEDLMEVQRQILDNAEVLLDRLEQIKVSKDDQSAYLALRESYNETKTPEKFLMLTLSCTNNLMRFNKSLKFNQTFGKRTMSERSKEKIRAWATAVGPHKTKVSFQSAPFQLLDVQAGDFCFCDPPYTNSEAGYNAYWSADDDARLLAWLQSLHERGGKFMLCGFEQHGQRPSWLLEQMEAAGFNRIALQSEYEKVSRSKRSKETQEVAYVNYKME